jgi:hypothetical protein
MNPHWRRWLRLLTDLDAWAQRRFEGRTRNRPTSEAGHTHGVRPAAHAIGQGVARRLQGLDDRLLPLVRDRSTATIAVIGTAAYLAIAAVVGLINGHLLATLGYGAILAFYPAVLLPIGRTRRRRRMGSGTETRSAEPDSRGD